MRVLDGSLGVDGRDLDATTDGTIDAAAFDFVGTGMAEDASRLVAFGVDPGVIVVLVVLDRGRDGRTFERLELGVADLTCSAFPPMLE